MNTRKIVEALLEHFEKVLYYANRTEEEKRGMGGSLPCNSDFADALRVPCMLGRIRWWAREMRKALDETETAQKKARNHEARNGD